MKGVHIAALIALAIGLAGVSAAAAATSSRAARVGTAHTGLGRVAADSHGRTLYLFAKDRHGRSSCSGLCATYWPPLITHGKPLAMAGVKRSLLGTTKRSDGRLQVTIAGRPVYRYFGDSSRGQTTGEGLDDFGAEWDAASPAGKRIEADG